MVKAKFRLGGQIGAGGFGQVLEATRVEDGWQCAVKRLSGTATGDDRVRFGREVRIQAKLRHSHVVPIMAVNTTDPLPWFVMPRALFTLRDMLKSRHGEEILHVFSQIADGVGYAHDNGILHRDLKPENILFFERQPGDVYAAVGDFGLGRFATRDTPSLTQSNMRMGTIEYMAPEQYTDSKNANHLADIYALGKLLYEILCGQIPYPVMDLNLVPAKFRYIIQKACDSDLSHRYQSVTDLLNDFSAVTETREFSTVPGDELQAEIQRVLEGQDFSGNAVANVARLLVENTDDTFVLTTVLPRLPDAILQAVIQQHETGMIQVLKAFDETLNGGLPFEYCDVVADFYDKLFRWSEAFDIKVLVIKRLPHLGYDHNRWHVGKTFARLLDGLTDVCLIREVATVFAASPVVYEWCSDYMTGHSYWKMLSAEVVARGNRVLGQGSVTTA